MRIRLFVFSLFAILFSMHSFAYRKKVKASFYADMFNGRKTSSGEVFYQDSLTCAHRTLPFGTVLKVKNLSNGKEVIVKVNDRGPFIKGRSIDLSYAAAKKIGMITRGVVTVEVSICPSTWEYVSYAEKLLKTKVYEVSQVKSDIENYELRLQGFLNGSYVQMLDATSMK